MNRFFKKIIDSLLKKTEGLSTTLDNATDEADPMQKKINSLLEKRELMKSAINEATKDAAKQETPPDQSSASSEEKITPLSKTIAESLAAKKSAITPPKQSQRGKPNSRR